MNEDNSSTRKRLADADGRVYCPHCEQSVAKRTYWLHKRQYYDLSMNTWLKDDDRVESSTSESEEYFDSVRTDPTLNVEVPEIGDHSPLSHRGEIDVSTILQT